MIESSTRTRVLCVDDEPHVLEGLTRVLRLRCTVASATSGAQALDVIEREAPFAVVISDLRMPGMDGVAFLQRVRQVSPDSIRILLTGYADLDAAIAAVNEGHIFRFLSKPCPPDTLLKALRAAAEQHRLMLAERVLLEQTLHGCVKALTDILALASPLAFGRATRVKQVVSSLATAAQVADRWSVEVAAMLSQIGAVSLPGDTLERVYYGQALSAEEQEMLSRVPRVTQQLLGGIPRLDSVLDILTYQAKRFDGSGMPRDSVKGEAIPWGARALKIAMDFDVLQTQGLDPAAALEVMRGRAGWYDPALLGELARIAGADKSPSRLREIPLRLVQPGMVFVEDVRTRGGVMLIARGQEVTEALVERVRNLAKHADVAEPVRVMLKDPAGAGSAAAPNGAARA